MNKRNTIGAIAIMLIGLPMIGCMPEMTIEQMREMTPERPVELDRLNAFVGTWDMEGEARMAGMKEAIKTTGTQEWKWDGDGWFLVSRAEFTMEGLEGMTGVENWTYDTHSKVYRSTWVDSMGTVGTGVSRYNERTREWRMTAKSHGPFGPSTMRGWMKFTDDDTMEWSMSEYYFLGLFKVMEMKGVSRRR